MLPILLAAVSGCAQPTSTETLTVSEGLHTVSDTTWLDLQPPAEGAADPWADPDYWTASGPLVELISPDLFPQTPHYRVLMYTSADGEQWSEGVAIAHSFAGLDLLVFDDVVILTGQPQSIPSEPGSLYALTSTDLAVWGSHAWSIVGPEFTDEASLARSADGTIRALYTTPDQGVSVAERDGAAFIETASDVLTGAHVDPTACHFDGQDHLFTTSSSGEIASATSEDGLIYTAAAFSWDGVQAPDCFVDDGKLWLVAQTGGGYGLPLVRRMDDSGEFGVIESLLPSGSMPLDSCTSPVLDRYHDTLLLFCAAWWE